VNSGDAAVVLLNAERDADDPDGIAMLHAYVVPVGDVASVACS
jgi:hypothetical protein